MNQQLPSPISFTSQASCIGASELDPCHTGPKNLSFDELAHELRQPLGVIESLAYYLELTAADEAVCAHVRQIQLMILQTHRILERTQTSENALAFAAGAC